MTRPAPSSRRWIESRASSGASPPLVCRGLDGASWISSEAISKRRAVHRDGARVARRCVHGCRRWLSTPSMMLERERGQLDQGIAIMERSVDEMPTLTAFRCSLRGCTPSAAATPKPSRSSRHRRDGASRCCLTTTRATAGRCRGGVFRAPRSHACSQALRALSPYAWRNVVCHPGCAIGSVSRYLAVLATLLERFDEATRHFEDALAMNENMGARPARPRAARLRATACRARHGQRPCEGRRAAGDRAGHVPRTGYGRPARESRVDRGEVARRRALFVFTRVPESDPRSDVRASSRSSARACQSCVRSD